jgi:hypothetical protein
MPTSVEAALILVVVVSPGFIAVAIKNGFVPYRQPSQFQETVESILLSTLLLPVWVSFARPLLRARDAVLATWAHGTTVPVGTIAQASGLVVLIYFVAAPVLGIVYGLLRRGQPPSAIANVTLRFGRDAWRRLRGSSGDGPPYRLGAGPEVWDDVIETDLSNTPWARVWFKDGTGVEGVVGRISTSPAPHQIYLTTLQGAQSTLLRLGSDGAVTADLGAQGALGVWVDLTSDVRCVEFLQ